MRGLSLEISLHLQMARPSGLTHSVTQTHSFSFINGQFSISTLPMQCCNVICGGKPEPYYSYIFT